ncbi:hypothetical protein [Wolbachia endosymbiont (group A) of Philanthus triangulum]
MNRGMTVCCLLAAKRYRGGMTVRGGIFVIPLLVSGIYVKRYRGGMT